MKFFKQIAATVVMGAACVFAQNLESFPAPVDIDPLNAVVRIDTCSYIPNYWIPWQDHGQDGCFGSGVVIGGNQILTNAHNLTYATYITVLKKSADDPFEAHIKAIDHDCDLALLEVDDLEFFKDIRPFELGDTPAPQTFVSVAGYPMGGDGLSITQGVISRIEIQPYVHSWHYLLAAQLDAAINPGNSGGPVVYRGRVVGIAFQGIEKGDGLGYMIPSEIISHFFTDIEDGKVDGFGGIGFRYITLENADTREFLKMKKEHTGVRIIHVSKNCQEYLHLDDVLLAIDGIPVANNGNIRLKTGEIRSFTTVVDKKQIGEIAELKLLRKGQELTVSLPVRKQEYQCERTRYDRLPDYYIAGGFVFTTLSDGFLNEWKNGNPPDALQRKMSVEKEFKGDQVVVMSTVLADKINLGYQGFRSEILTKVNNTPIHNLKDLIEFVETSQDEFITFYFGENETPVTLNLQKVREQTPEILKQYRIPADRSQNL